MIKKKNIIIFIIWMFLFIQPFNELFSQTAGTFSFTVTTTAPSGSYGSKNLLAIWIENGSSSFIKTKIMYCSVDNLDHLNTWVVKSAQNVVDAVTGSTRDSHGTVTFLWNGTNIGGSIVPDGTYTVWLEMAWDRSLSTDKTVYAYPFTKGASLFTSNPANSANFQSISLQWTPSTTGTEAVIENEDVNVFPNPTKGLLNIDFKNPANECLIQIIDESGKVIFKENHRDIQKGVLTLNLGSIPAGIYYCSIRFPGKNLVFSIVLVK